MVRKRTFATCSASRSTDAEPMVVLAVPKPPATSWRCCERAGHPFFVLGWGRDAMGMVLDDPDWDEVRELVTESFCALAPKKLIALVDRPPTAHPERS